MKIVNPIYDNTFKYLMDNEQIAKIVLSIILDTKVISLQSKPQETPFLPGSINMSRFDFKAIIQNQHDENRAVLIEIQKYKTPNPILRFRQYLAKNYIKEETIINAKGKEETLSLPIISIYILGFDLPEFKCKAIRVDNSPYDIVGQKALTIKSDFVDLLTHQCFILLATNKDNTKKQNTRLEKFLNLFIQKLRGDSSNPIIDIEVDTKNDPELQRIVDYLNNATLDEELIRRIDAEKQYHNGIESLEKQVEEAKAREEEERRQKEEERRQKKEAMQKLALKMKKYGEPIEEIMKETGLSEEEIEKI